MPIKVIDLFAGPGGLGEGFSVFESDGRRPFHIAVSVEKDPAAHKTLLLRSFFRQFPPGEAPDLYYSLLSDSSIKLDERLDTLYAEYPEQYTNAKQEAWLHVLSGDTSDQLARKISRRLRGADSVLIGGPPCQAYSLAGRSRNKGKRGYTPENDKKHFLYKEYLHAIAEHQPVAFVMENVKGLLSSTVGNQRIFENILADLKCPANALRNEGRNIRQRRVRTAKYKLYSMTCENLPGYEDVSDFIIKMERFGIPQARHRLILLGVRMDIASFSVPEKLEQQDFVSVNDVLLGMPRVRSGFSQEADTPQKWQTLLLQAPWRRWCRIIQADSELFRSFESFYQQGIQSNLTRGAEFFPSLPVAHRLNDWYIDPRLNGYFNHSTRSHMTDDILRYLFCSCYAIAYGKSPTLREFPDELLPNHNNVQEALDGAMFADRFRVQVGGRPSTTITSHISKDGHYYIHPDPTQARSLTVREAARLQTFPDNYFFCGNRTKQYEQVGNAVPPLLSRQIAGIVWKMLVKAGFSND